MAESSTIRISNKTKERIKSLSEGKSADKFLNDLMDQVYGAPGANHTNNNAPPKPAPAPVQEPDPLTLTFITQKDAIKTANRLNAQLGYIRYFTLQPDEDKPFFKLGYHPRTPEEAEELERQMDPLKRMSWSEYLHSLRYPAETDCASH